MTLLLLLSAMLSALTGVGGSSRAIETPVVAAQAAATVVAEAGDQLIAQRFDNDGAMAAPRMIAGRAFVLTAAQPTYLNRRRE